MAHAGKAYPVHFRRDLNVNSVTNNEGWPRAFGLISSNGQGEVGLHLAGNRWVCIAQQEKTFHGLLYESQYITVNGHDVMFRLTGNQDTWDTSASMQGLLIDRVKGTLGRFGNGYGTTGRYHSGSGSYELLFSPFPDLFRVFDSVVVATNAVLWEEWNNL